jgi:hypothetical protein
LNIPYSREGRQGRTDEKSQALKEANDFFFKFTVIST